MRAWTTGSSLKSQNLWYSTNYTLILLFQRQKSSIQSDPNSRVRMSEREENKNDGIKFYCLEGVFRRIVSASAECCARTTNVTSLSSSTSSFILFLLSFFELKKAQYARWLLTFHGIIFACVLCRLAFMNAKWRGKKSFVPFATHSTLPFLTLFRKRTCSLSLPHTYIPANSLTPQQFSLRYIERKALSLSFANEDENNFYC